MFPQFFLLLPLSLSLFHFPINVPYWDPAMLCFIHAYFQAAKQFHQYFLPYFGLSEPSNLPMHLTPVHRPKSRGSSFPPAETLTLYKSCTLPNCQLPKR